MTMGKFGQKLAIHGGLPLKSIGLDQLLPSNLLKTDFPLKLTIHKCQRKQQCIVEPWEMKTEQQIQS